MNSMLAEPPICSGKVRLPDLVMAAATIMAQLKMKPIQACMYQPRCFEAGVTIRGPFQRLVNKTGKLGIKTL